MGGEGPSVGPPRPTHGAITPNSTIRCAYPRWRDGHLGRRHRRGHRRGRGSRVRLGDARQGGGDHAHGPAGTPRPRGRHGHDHHVTGASQEAGPAAPEPVGRPRLPRARARREQLARCTSSSRARRPSIPSRTEPGWSRSPRSGSASSAPGTRASSVASWTSTTGSASPSASRCAGCWSTTGRPPPPRVIGDELPPGEPPPSRRRPAAPDHAWTPEGVAHLDRLPHSLLGWVGSDGLSMVARVRGVGADEAGVRLVSH